MPGTITLIGDSVFPVKQESIVGFSESADDAVVSQKPAEEDGFGDFDDFEEADAVWEETAPEALIREEPKELNEENLLDGFMTGFKQEQPMGLKERIEAVFADEPDFESVISRLKQGVTDEVLAEEHTLVYLKSINCMDTVQSINSTKSEIQLLEQKKKVAAIDEDFEVALVCKNLINMQITKL